MSSLTDRLAAASRDRANVPVASSDAIQANGHGGIVAKASAEDEFKVLKAQVHTKLLQQFEDSLTTTQKTSTEQDSTQAANMFAMNKNLNQ